MFVIFLSDIQFNFIEIINPPPPPPKRKNSLSSINFDLANGSSCEYCFLEPMDWMGDISSAQGTLYCPNEDCKAVLGDWCWEGDQLVLTPPIEKVKLFVPPFFLIKFTTL